MQGKLDAIKPEYFTMYKTFTQRKKSALQKIEEVCIDSSERKKSLAKTFVEFNLSIGVETDK